MVSAPILLHKKLRIDFEFCLSTSTQFWITSTDKGAWPQGDQFLGGGLVTHGELVPGARFWFSVLDGAACAGRFVEVDFLLLWAAEAGCRMSIRRARSDRTIFDAKQFAAN